ncbi:FkbM family methyltransferase [Pseudooctadecabacter sp.]|uniref:FkbM family methyltransferase n=1 Tax=Pseudooctadecabacter sp. TaxID=1966338 RepID=UPI0025E45EA7|nr:FkbM family methyltransferase [Pseudooctadecabacter sp.]
MARTTADRLSFLKDELDPKDMKILDVGANPINVPAYQPLIDRQMCHVWGFEPNPKAFADLQKVQNDRATYFPQAIGPEGKGTFYAHEFAVLSSLFPIYRPTADFLGRERWYEKQVTKMEMDLVTIDSLDDLPRVDVLKMDLQGGELSVVEGGRDRLSEAMVVIPEVRFIRMYEGEPLWAELDLELRAQGFQLHKFQTQKALPVKHSQWRKLDRKAVGSQLLDGDAVYIRNIEDISIVTSHQLKQLAIAATVMFDSFDLALHCLDELARRGDAAGDVAERFVPLLPAQMMKATA